VANDKQFKTRTMFIATRGVKEYRASIAQWVDPDDTVLEIGCEFGTTTRELAARARHVLGTDISAECIERAKQMHPELHFQTLDAFDIRSVMDIGTSFSKIYIDISGISGYRSLLDVLALLNMYASVLAPEAIVVKSGALKHLAEHCIAWKAPAPA
jgi:SAM-dependent methyltransferase